VRYPKVTIGLPFFNPGPFFESALKSIFAQTFEDWELILVDDGSTDGSSDLAAKIKDSRVRLIRDGSNHALSRRLNEISRLASAPIIFRFDADDIMPPNRLERMHSEFQRSPNLDLVSTNAVLLNRESRPLGIRGFRNMNKPSALEILRTGGIIHASIAARTEWYKSNPYNPAYLRAEDRELFIRTYTHTEILHLNLPLYFYHKIGNIRPQAYLNSYQTERRILREYGPRAIGKARSAQLLARSCCKTFALASLAGLGLHNRLIKENMAPIPNDDLEFINQAFAAIKSTALPL
jgi:glycosyltransferase involved in cell wall biosynthesis